VGVHALKKSWPSRSGRQWGTCPKPDCTLTAETSAVAVESDKLGAGQGSRFSLDVAVRCQSARKFDPSSASNLPRVLLVALGSSALTGIAETRRVRVA
jgi:hypothetical protein